MSGITDFLKKDISFKRKPSAGTAAPKQEKTPKNESPKRRLSVPKRAPKQRKTSSGPAGGRP